MKCRYSCGMIIFFAAGSCSFLYAMQHQKMHGEYDKRKLCGLTQLWRNHYVEMKGKYFTHNQGCPGIQNVYFNSCNTYFFVNCLCGEAIIHTDFFDAVVRYLEDYLCDFSQAIKDDPWVIMSDSEDDLIKLLEFPKFNSIKKDGWKFIDTWTGQTIMRVNGFKSSFGICLFILYKNFREKKDYLLQVHVLDTYKNFGKNKDLFLLPVFSNEGEKHVYLCRYCLGRKNPIELVADLGCFTDPQCGAIDATSKKIVICDGIIMCDSDDKVPQNLTQSSLTLFSLTQLGLDKIE